MKGFKFKQLMTSLSLRINLILFTVMIILGWTFTKGVTFLVGSISNSNLCQTMSQVVTHAIDDHLLRVENVMKAGAMTSQAKQLTQDNSRTFCDSLRSMCKLDTVYVIKGVSSIPEINSSVSEISSDVTSRWTEPYRNKKTGGSVISFLTPLCNSHGHMYAVLCADMSLRWLNELAGQEIQTDNTAITVLSPGGRYIYHQNGKLIATKAQTESDDTISNKEAFLNMGVSKVSGTQPTTEISKTIDRVGWRVTCAIPINENTNMVIVVTAVTYIMMFLLFGFMALSIVLTLRWQLHPLTKITEAARAISEGNFDVEIPRVRQHTDIRQLRNSFVRMQEALKQYILDLRRALKSQRKY